MKLWKFSSRTLLLIIAGIGVTAVICVSAFYPRILSARAAVPPEGIVLPNELKQVGVYVTGAVKKPGVYSLPNGSRVKDALSLSGVAADWDPEGINLAKRLEDEDMIVVPRKQHDKMFSKDQTFSPKPSAKKIQTPGEKVNLNHATVSDLQSVPGVGPGMAKRIIDYRVAHGAFSSVDALREIPGIGQKKFERMKPYLQL